MKMKGALVLGVLACLLFASAHATWQLQWSDEFSGTSLDTSKWDIEVNCWGGGNGEKQCYTARPQNIFVSGGNLHLKPVAGTYQGSNTGCTLNNENSCTWTQPATSGRVRTLNAVDGSWKYGRFEVRAKLPKGNWLWPAIWMLPTDNVYGTWAASGEIDIMEARGQVPNQVSSTVHYGGVWPNNQYTTSGDMTFGVDFTADYHIFALEWNSSALNFYIDESLTYTQSLQRSFGSIYQNNGAPFDQKFHLLLNVAVAGGFFDASRFGTFDIATASPTWTQEFLIDYVRVYQWIDSTTDPIPATPAITGTPVTTSPPVSAPVAAPSSSSSSSCLQMVLFPVHDAYVDISRSSMNFGSESTLALRTSATNSGKQGRTAYLKYFLPRGRAPTRAILNLWGGLEEDSTSTVNVVVNSVPSNSWTEDAITYDNRPADCGSSCVSAIMTVTTTAGWNLFDVLPIVQSAINSGADVVSFSVSLASAGHATFNSGDAPLNKPALSLAYAA